MASYKYLKVEEHIKTKINAGEYKTDDQIESEAVLTKQFGVSRQTVRTAIANLVSEGFLYTSQGKGTFVGNKQAVSREPHVIGFTATRFSDYTLFPKIFSEINNQVAVEGYSLLMKETLNNVEQEYAVLKSFLERDVDALIHDPCTSALPTPNHPLLMEFVKAGKPVVFYNGCRRDISEASYIIADDEHGGFLAAEHLIRLGHRKIFTVQKIDDTQGHGRYAGFVNAFRHYGVPIPTENIVFFSSKDYPYFWPNSNVVNKPLEEALLEQIHSCTAMVAYNDYIAAKIIHLLVENNIGFPNDFSVVSFDDTNLTYFSGVPLTSITHPGGQAGEEIGKAVLQMLHDPTQVIRKVLPVSIIVRESAQPYNK